MSDNPFQPDQQQLDVVFGYVGLPLSGDRLAANYDDYASTLALIRSVSAVDLGETVPAVGFNARWE